jgi:O-antigen/teichoic acid export membrane protein
MRQADRLIVNVLANYALTLVAGTAGLVMVPVVLTGLGAEGYGLAALLQAAFLSVQTLADGGSRALQRFVPQDLAIAGSRRVNATFSSGMAWFAALGAAGTLLIWCFRGVYLESPGIDAAQRSEVLLTLGLILAALALGSPLNVYRAGLEALQRYDLASLRVGVATALRALLVIALFKLGYGSIPAFVGSLLAATIATGLWCRVALRRELPGLRISVRSVGVTPLRALAAFSMGVMLIAAGNLLGTEGFRLLVGRMFGLADVGMFSALLAFRTMAATLIENMSNVLTPAASALEARGASARLGPLLILSTKYASIAASLICVVPLAVARSFLGLWLGEDALPFAPVMFAILLGQLPALVSAGAQQMLVGLGATRLAGSTVVGRGIGSLLAAFAYLFWWPTPGLLGATLCLYAVQIAGGVAMFVFGARATGADPVALIRNSLLRPVGLAALGAAVTALASEWLGSSTWMELIACVALGELTFLGLVAWLGLDRGERERLREFAVRAYQWAR